MHIYTFETRIKQLSLRWDKSTRVVSSKHHFAAVTGLVSIKNIERFRPFDKNGCRCIQKTIQSIQPEQTQIRRTDGIQMFNQSNCFDLKNTVFKCLIKATALIKKRQCSNV